MTINDETRKDEDLGRRDFNSARRTLAAIYVRLGRLAEAQAVIKTLLENSPGYTLENVRLNFKDKFKNPADLEQYVEDLRKAGLPE